jgi:hypothetical protein
VTTRGIPSARKVPCGTCDIHSISASMNWEVIFLRDLTVTLGYCCMKVIVNVSHLFVDDLIYRLRKILAFFLPLIRELFSCSYLVGNLVVMMQEHHHQHSMRQVEDNSTSNTHIHNDLNSKESASPSHFESIVIKAL